MSSKPRLATPNPDFGDAVVREILKYRDEKQLKNLQVADLLDISPSTLSKYLSRKIEMGGAVLARALVVLEIEVDYRGRVISAKPPEAGSQLLAASSQQIAFEFDSPYLLTEKDGGIAITITRKGIAAEGIIATVRIAS